MPSWKDLGNVWDTLRELDVNDIREESERPLSIACIGQPELFEMLSGFLYHSSDRRYGPAGTNPLSHYIPPLGASLDPIRHADALLVLIDGRRPLAQTDIAVFDRLDSFALPLLVVVFYGDRLPAPTSGVGAAPPASTRVVTIREPVAISAADVLAEAVLTILPSELHLTAARRLPGIRPIVARELINNTAFSNAAYSLAAGLPEQIPILGLPFAAADILILTKNQAILVYKLALGYGAPPEFQSRIREVLPVIGGAYIWRQMARSLVGLIPIWGLLPKVAIAYAGTYTTGVVAWRWYATGEIISGERLKQVSQDALSIGRERARQLLDQARAQGGGLPGRARQFFGALRLPRAGKREKPESTSPPGLTPPAE